MSDLPARMEKLRIRDLLLLEYIHECGSLRQVAERLHITQPAVTLALQVIEDAFGVALVQRGRRGVTLTETGEAVLKRLSVGRKELAAAYSLAIDPAAPHLRLGCSPIAAIHLIPAVLAKFLQALPERSGRVTITESSVPGLWGLLNQGDLDAIVCPLPNAGQVDLITPGTVHQFVGAERLVLVTSRQGRLGKGALDMNLLASQAWVLPPKDSKAGLMLIDWFMKAGFTPPVATVVSASFQTSLMLVASAGMVTLAPESAARDLAGALGLKVIETGTEWGRIEIAFAHRASSLHIPELVVLKQCFAELSASAAARPAAAGKAGGRTRR